MPYNGSGVFSIPNSFTPSTTILSSEVNANFADIAAGLGSVLTRDNQAPMTDVLRIADGTEALPGLMFADDPNTGLWRSDADEFNAVTGGAAAMMWDVAQKTWALGEFDAAGAANFQAAVAMALTLVVTGLITATAGINIGAADTTITRTGAGDIAVGGNGIYRSGGADVAIADGGTGAGTAADAFAALKQAASDTATGVVEIAVQSEMEAAADTGRVVTPARQHFHPGMPKAAGRGGSGGGIEGTAYNVAGIVQNGTGDYTVTLTNAMADTNYWVAGSPLAAGVSFTATITSASTFDVDIRNFNNTPQDQDFGFAVFGDMA
jgi:hypothetical protein